MRTARLKARKRQRKHGLKFEVGPSRRDAGGGRGGFAGPQPLHFGDARRIGLIEREGLDLNARERALIVAARIHADATVIDVDSAASRPSLARKKGSRRVTKKAQLAIIAFEEFQVASPDEHFGIRLRRMFARNQPGMNVD